VAWQELSGGMGRTLLDKRVWWIGGPALLAMIAALFSWSNNSHADLVRDLDSADPATRAAAAETLAKRGHRAIDERVDAMLGEGPDVRMAHGAAVGYAKRGDEQARQQLRRMMSEARDAAVRGAAAAAWGMTEDTGASPLLELLKSEDAEARLGAMTGLSRMADPDRRDLLPVFLNHLSDSDTEMRRRSIRALHRVTVTRFSFDPQEDPQSAAHRQSITFIQNYLTQHGVVP